VASQSPAEVPADEAGASEANSYIRAWQATTELLRRGHNWSGHEANVCFLNTHSTRFVDVSAVSGIDYLDDARGLAVVDWDRDGDLDLWFTNRTSPRVRYLQNEASSDNRSVALKLRGTSCNRDAIGARVELHRGPEPQNRLIQSLRAGEGYLAQSSKTIHFGLGADPHIEKVVVRWPGGAAEEFTGVVAGACFELVQGEGMAHKIDRGPVTNSPSLAASPELPRTGATTRIVAARRLPLPPLVCSTVSGQELRLDEGLSGPRLVMLWAPWCQPCLVELAELSENAAALRDAGLEIMPVNVDGAKPEAAASLSESADVLRGLGFDGVAAIATSDLLDRLDVAQRVLTNKPFPPPIPSSFLLDRDGKLVCVYKGPVRVDQLIQDVKKLDSATADPRDAALPFAGRWYTAPFPPDLLAIPSRLVQIGKPDAALAYLSSVDSTSDAGNREFARLFAGQLAAAYVDLAKHFAAQQKLEIALSSLRNAVKHQEDNWDAHFGMAALLSSLGRQREAADEYRILLRLRPNHILAARNLAWILATSGDPALQNPAEAIRLAEAACAATQYRSPADLDALAAAYAAAGRFDEAAATANKAISILVQAGRQDGAAAIAERLRLYQDRKPLAANPASPSE
jgi:Tfp pilus assembly protein PilF/thiol-disulfide isomerase/thioredoxin